jgi:hypothetical protein
VGSSVLLHPSTFLLGILTYIRPVRFGLSATSQQYFSLRTNQPPTTSQQYFSLRTNQHHPSATSQTNRLIHGQQVIKISILIQTRTWSILQSIGHLMNLDHLINCFGQCRIDALHACGHYDNLKAPEVCSLQLYTSVLVQHTPVGLGPI